MLTTEGKPNCSGGKTCTTVTLSTTSPRRIRPNAAKTGESDNRRPIYLSRTQLYIAADWITNGCVWLALCRSLVVLFGLNSCIKLTHAPRTQSAFDSKPNRCELQNLLRGWQLSESHFNQPALVLSPPLTLRQILTDTQQIPSHPPSSPPPSPFSYNARDQSSHRWSAFCYKCQCAVTTLTKKHEFRTLRQHSYCGFKTTQFTTATQAVRNNTSLVYHYWTTADSKFVKLDVRDFDLSWLVPIKQYDLAAVSSLRPLSSYDADYPQLSRPLIFQWVMLAAYML